MKICVIGTFEAGSSFAHAINTTKMADGFARLGHEVTLFCKGDPAISCDELRAQYGLSEALQWRIYPHKWAGLIPLGTNERFAWAIRAEIAKIQPDFVYGRSFSAPCMTARMGIPTAIETHAHVGTRYRPFLKTMRQAAQHEALRTLVTISDVLAGYYQSLGAPENKTLVLPDSVDLVLFSPPSDGQERPDVYAGHRGPHITYCGHLYDYKGIPTVLEAARSLPDASFHFVGGHQEDIDRQRAKAAEMGLRNVVFHGLKPLSEVPAYLWAADLLLLPPSLNHPSAQWTSPVKLAEYCASETPFIASDIPALKDWLTDAHTQFFKADDAKSLTSAIQAVLDPQNAALTQSRIAGAKALAEGMTYPKRAQTILDASGFGAQS